MILKKAIENKVEGDSFEGFDAGITKKNMGKMFSVVSKNMYRAPIKSIVREITSNCFDSHIEAKVDDPVVIKLAEDEGGEYILFKDVGMGISPERMKKVYANWFESTKEDTDDQIGMWGLGSKSPLAYTSQFYLTTVFNGKKYEYVVREGVDRPRIDFLLEDDTEERNGTEVKIYTKNPNDIVIFHQACRSELVYFDNVYVESNYGTINNAYKVYEYNTFKFRPDNSYSDELHIILGKVAYPINWTELDIKAIDLPFGIQFQIGDLMVTPERESIRYVDIEKDNKFIPTKEIILDRIRIFLDEICKLYDKQSVYEFEDFTKWKKYNEQSYPSIEVGPEGDKYTYNVKGIVEKKQGIFLPLKEYQCYIPENLFTSYSIIKEYNKGAKVRDRNQTCTYDTFKTLCITIPKGTELKANRIAYILHCAFEWTSISRFYIIEEDVNRKKLTSALRYYKIGLDSWNYEETNALKQYQLITSFIVKEFRRLTYRYEDLVPTTEWLKSQKEQRQQARGRKGDDFLVYNYGKATLAEGKEYVTIEEFEDFEGFLVYGFEQDEELLKDFRVLFSSSKYAIGRADNTLGLDQSKCRLYKIAQRTEKHFLDMSNAVYIKDFMGNNKIFKRFATAALIEDESKAIYLEGLPLGDAITFVKAMELIFPPVAETLKELLDMCEEFGRAAYTRVDNKVSDKFFNELVSVAREYNLYDEEMYQAHLKLERYVEGLDLLNYVVINEKSINFIVDFLRLKGKKIAPQWISLEQYEKELIDDCITKCKYQRDIYRAESGFRGSDQSILVMSRHGYRDSQQSYQLIPHKVGERTRLNAVIKLEFFDILLKNYEKGTSQTASN